MQRKKWHPKFVVPGFNTVNRSRLPDRWRKQRGNSNKKRLQRSGYGAKPHIGYRNSDAIRYLRSDGKKEILVHNEKELHNVVAQKHQNAIIVIAHDISKRKRLVMQAVADKAGLKVANAIKKQEAPKAPAAQKKEAPKTPDNTVKK